MDYYQTNMKMLLWHGSLHVLMWKYSNLCHFLHQGIDVNKYGIVVIYAVTIVLHEPFNLKVL